MTTDCQNQVLLTRFKINFGLAFTNPLKLPDNMVNSLTSCKSNITLKELDDFKSALVVADGGFYLIYHYFILFAIQYNLLFIRKLHIY